jgi:cell wall-associated NlpC family hydrolase
MEAAARAAAPTASVPSAPVPAPVPATPPAPTDSSPPATTTTDASSTAAPPPTVSEGHPQAAEVALGYLGVPYQWGGGTPAGFDCSGLVSYVFAQLGVELPHYAAAQYGYGAPVSRDQLQPGDLVFFDNLNHVGIYIGGDEFVDAPHTGTFVRIESLDDPWYANRYVGARRI